MKRLHKINWFGSVRMVTRSQEMITVLAQADSATHFILSRKGELFLVPRALTRDVQARCRKLRFIVPKYGRVAEGSELHRSIVLQNAG